MQVGGYPVSPYAAYGAARPLERPATGSGRTTDAADATPGSAAEAFLAETRKTPAQRIREDWLARHNLDENSLVEMSKEKREALEKEIAETIRDRLTGGDGKVRRGSAVDVSA